MEPITSGGGVSITGFVFVWIVGAAALLGWAYLRQREAFKAMPTRNRWQFALWCLRWPLTAVPACIAAASAKMESLR